MFACNVRTRETTPAHKFGFQVGVSGNHTCVLLLGSDVEAKMSTAWCFAEKRPKRSDGLGHTRGWTGTRGVHGHPKSDACALSVWFTKETRAQFS